MDYELRAAKARQAAIREQTGYTPRLKVEPMRWRPEAKPTIDYVQLAMKIQAEVGNCVPDGDPYDALRPYLQRLGIWQAPGRHLNKAARVLGFKSYTAYLISMWDMFNEICEPDQRRDNPWK